MQFKDKKGNYHLSNQYAITANIKSDLKSIQKRFTKEDLLSKPAEVMSKIKKKKDDLFKDDNDNDNPLDDKNSIQVDDNNNIDSNAIFFLKDNKVIYNSNNKIDLPLQVSKNLVEICNEYIVEDDSRTFKSSLDHLFDKEEVKTLIKEYHKILFKVYDEASPESVFKDLTRLIDQIINIYFVGDDMGSNRAWPLLVSNFYQIISAEIIDRIIHSSNYRDYVD